MKSGLIILTTFNLILTVCLVFFLTRKNQETYISALPVKRADPQATVLFSDVPTVRPVELKPFRWSQLKSSDYRTYVQNLRNSGCPEATVRAIVTADVDAVYRHDREEIELKLADLINGSLAIQLKSYDEQQSLKARLQKMPADESSEIAYLLGSTAALSKTATDANTTSAATRVNTNTVTALPPTAMATDVATISSQIQADTDAATTSSLTQPATDASQMNVASTPSSLLNYHIGGKVVPLVYPVVFQKADPTSLQLNVDQIQAIQNLQQSFVDQIGGPNQNPNDPAYRLRWQQSQIETDNELRFILGWGGFSSYQMLAQQGNADSTTTGTP